MFKIRLIFKIKNVNLKKDFNKFIMSVTYKPKRKKRRRTHGFLARKNKFGGKRVLKARRRKKRKKLTV